MAKPDLNKLRTEIDDRKKQKILMHNGMQPRDSFLNGLLESLQTGKETASSALVKTVDNTVAVNSGEKPILNIKEQVKPINTQQVSEQVNMSPERDEELWAEVERRKKHTLAESMQQYINAPNVGAPMNLNSYPQNSNTNIGYPAVGLNEQYLTENVKKIVDNYLIENFGPIVEEAIKSTILEMYAVERIKEVLTENKEMIKSLVYDTIREIQEKVKEKKAQQ